MEDMTGWRTGQGGGYDRVDDRLGWGIRQDGACGMGWNREDALVLTMSCECNPFVKLPTVV